MVTKKKDVALKLFYKGFLELYICGRYLSLPEEKGAQLGYTDKF